MVLNWGEYNVSLMRPYPFSRRSDDEDMVDYVRFNIMVELDNTHYLTMAWCLGPSITPGVNAYTADVKCMRVFAVLKNYTEQELRYDEPLNNPYVPNMDCAIDDFWESEIMLTSPNRYRHIDCDKEIGDIICENDSSYILNWNLLLTNIVNLSKAKADNEDRYVGVAQQFHEIICGFADVLKTLATHEV